MLSEVAVAVKKGRRQKKGKKRSRQSKRFARGERNCRIQ